MNSDKNIAAVVIAYNTHCNDVKALLEIIHNETLVIIIDNSTDPELAQAIEYQAGLFDAIYHGMRGNAGVGAAQNVGLRIAKANGCKYVLLLDDDSLPSESMIARLMRHPLSASRSDGNNIIACANPVYLNPGTNYRLPHVGAVVPRTEMMSSGSLIPIHAFDAVGGFDEDFFVDYVDYDWGWRALSLGFRIYMIGDAVLFHRLGEGDKRLSGISLRIPTPIRHYFQTRNVFMLWKRQYVPTRWKLLRLAITPIKFLLVLAVEGERTSRIKYFCRGLLDGFRGVKGDCPH